MGAENKLSFEFNPIVRGMKIAESNSLFPIHRVFCVGKNYAEHAKEMGSEVEKKEPFFFSKVPESVTQVDKILIPEDTANLHHEVELVVCLKKGGMNIDVDAAHQCMTMRGIKKEKATTVTNYFLGSFREDLSIQNRYLRYIAK